MSSVWIAVHQPDTSPAHEEAAAAIRLHGFFSTLEDARGAARALTQNQPDITACVVDECARWIRVREPERGSAEEEEEVSAPENNDPAGGRMGSVCDLGPRVTVVQEEAANTKVAAAVFEPPTGSRAARVQEGNEQRSQLERLLSDPVADIVSPATYADARERYALLRAFDRKLHRLLDESLGKWRAAMDRVVDLDQRHPTYTDEYQGNYRRALRESGVRPEDVQFMRFLDQTPPPRRAGN